MSTAITSRMIPTAGELEAARIPREDWDRSLVDAAFLADRTKKLALWDAIRTEDPVYWAEPDGFRPFWILTRYDDVVAGARNAKAFSAEKARWLHFSIEEEERALAATGRRKLTRTLVEMDDPDHKSYRTIAHKYFLPPNLKTLRPEIERLAASAVARMEGRSSLDFTEQVGTWLPIDVIMLILGLPTERSEWVMAMTDQALYPNDPDMQRDKKDSALEATNEIFKFYGELARERRENPTEDVASVIANATIDGEPIGEFEAMSYYWALTLAGNDTTAANISGGLALLLEDPDSFARLRADVDGLLPGAVEEILRYVSISNGFFRAAVEDVEVGGKLIRAGDDVLFSYGAANFDPAQFEDPYAFRIDRKPNRHISFGQGLHHCLGRDLAKIELELFFRELIARTNWIELDGEMTFAEARIGNPHKSLPIRYELAA